MQRLQRLSGKRLSVYRELKRMRKAHEERLLAFDERGRLLAESKAKEERAEEERRQKRAEELRAAAAAAELKAAQKKAKEQKQLMEFEKKAKKQADEQAEKEALKAQKAALKAEHAKSTDDAKARKTEEARQGKLDVGSPSKLSIADRLRPDSTQRSGAGKVASQRLERSSYRLSFRQDELTPRSETEEDHDANQLTTFNAAVRGLAIDKRAAELLAQKLEEKKRKLKQHNLLRGSKGGERERRGSRIWKLRPTSMAIRSALVTMATPCSASMECGLAFSPRAAGSVY